MSCRYVYTVYISTYIILDDIGLSMVSSNDMYFANDISPTQLCAFFSNFPQMSGTMVCIVLVNLEQL